MNRQDIKIDKKRNSMFTLWRKVYSTNNPLLEISLSKVDFDA